MMSIFENEYVKMDICHAQTIGGLIVSQKPTNILELGVGGGRSTDHILASIAFNENTPKYTLVDNWCDFGGNIPNEIIIKYSNIINIITANEKDFIFSTKEKYDFIVSDADHHHTNEWFEYVYDNLLSSDGILIYHDINIHNIDDAFPNLLEILNLCKTKNIHHKLFNRSTKENERCHRGLLVIFKHKEIL
jgi:predicted O-methyltransferase YrrM